MDWRSRNEYCNVGYYPDHKRKSLGEPIVDNYASGIEENPTKKSDADSRIDLNLKLKGLQEYDERTVGPQIKVAKPKNKVHKTMNLMNLGDISEDYEAQFWS